MKRYLPDESQVQARLIDNYIRTNPDKVFIIFDGLDEYNSDLSLPHSKDIVQILRSDLLRKCTVLVTTRPWKAHQVRLQTNLVRTYAFVAVEGFSEENLSVYILKFFKGDKVAGRDLIKFMDENDVIKENMAPYPIYTAMLCLLWRNSDSKRRDKIRSLQTFSQVFQEMIRFLTNHFISKNTTDPTEIEQQTKFIEEQLGVIGSIAFSGLLKNKLLFLENEFESCHGAMEIACRVGVLTQQKAFAPRRAMAGTASHQVLSKVLFPHKLFQEFISGLYVARLFDTNKDEFEQLINENIIPKATEFRYLLYFTTSQSSAVGDVILSKLMKLIRTTQSIDTSFLVDVAFECYDETVCKSLGRSLFQEQKLLQIDDKISAHTVSGYFFIMEKNAMV